MTCISVSREGTKTAGIYILEMDDSLDLEELKKNIFFKSKKPIKCSYGLSRKNKKILNSYRGNINYGSNCMAIYFRNSSDWILLHKN